MSKVDTWDAAHANQSAQISTNERKMTEVALKSLREYRRMRYADRQLPSQPRKSA